MPDPNALVGPEDRRIAALAVDPWDAAAHFESGGTSLRVANERGFDSVFDLAGAAAAGLDRGQLAASRAARTPRPPVSLVAAVLRTLIMLATVATCVTSLPRDADEITVFAIAAAGWLSGQAVNSGVWYAWGVGRKPDGLRTGLVTACVVGVLATVATVVTGQWDLLIWVGFGVATPLLVLTANLWLLTLALGLVGAACVVSYFARLGYPWAPPWTSSLGAPLAVAATAGAVVLGLALTAWKIRREGASRQRGALIAIAIALLQTVFQLAILLQIFLGIGAGAFGSVALAGLASGALADPLYTLQQAWTRHVVTRSSSWRLGRMRIGLAAVVVTALIIAIAGVVVWVALSDPYKIYLNEPSVIVAAMVASAVIAATNVLLRTGSPISAMAFAAFAEILVIVTSRFPVDEPAGFWALVVVCSVVSLFALVSAGRRFAHPSTW